MGAWGRAVGPAEGGGGLGVVLAAAEQVADGADAFGEGVEFVGDRQLEPLLDLAFEFLDFILVVALELARSLRRLAVHAPATV